MERYFVKKKPIELKAYQTDQVIYIDTIEGKMKANKGDWIISGIEGEMYPVKKEIFDKTYEIVRRI